MPRYMGEIANAAGSALAVFDAILPLHANWSVHDAAAATNAKVYKCAGDVTYYVYIGDNQTNYFTVVLWAAWDAGTHAGSGSTTNASPVYFCKYYSQYAIYLNGNRFVFINYLGNDCYGHYCGLIKRIDTSKNLVLVCGGTSATYYKTYNCLEGRPDGTYNRWRFLEDMDGTQNIAGNIIGNSAGEYERFCMDLNGVPRIQETGVYVRPATLAYFVGFLDGVQCLFNTNLGMPIQSGDIFTADGVDWELWMEGSTTPTGKFLMRRSD